jgi:hypothetical protein
VVYRALRLPGHLNPAHTAVVNVAFRYLNRLGFRFDINPAPRRRAYAAFDYPKASLNVDGTEVATGSPIDVRRRGLRHREVGEEAALRLGGTVQ